MPQLLVQCINFYYMFIFEPFSHNKNFSVENLTIINEVESIFQQANRNANQRLLLVFIGGGFIYNLKENYYPFCDALCTSGSNNFDILIFNYPTRFENNLHQTMLAINSILKKYHKAYSEFYGLGISAGALLCGTFIAKETSERISTALAIPAIGLQISKFIALDGLLDINNLTAKSVINFLLFKLLIVKNVENSYLYNCNNIPETVNKLLITTDSDFLFRSQTKLYSAVNTEKMVLENTSHLRHCFFQNLSHPETKKIIMKINSFLNLKFVNENV